MNLGDKSKLFSLDDEQQEEDQAEDNRGGVVITEAVKLLDETEGRNISKGGNSLPRDFLFAYILLRHLRIRDIRYKVQATPTINHATPTNTDS